MARVNCAVYVRKSTEKGLELEFNSLHNQEDACRSYIMSQAFNNWEYFKTYTDGGISGGTMERPALKQMLEDIRLLLDGKPVTRKGYNYAEHRRDDSEELMYPPEVLIIEGIHVFMMTEYVI